MKSFNIGNLVRIIDDESDAIFENEYPILDEIAVIIGVYDQVCSIQLKSNDAIYILYIEKLELYTELEYEVI